MSESAMSNDTSQTTVIASESVTSESVIASESVSPDVPPESLIRDSGSDPSAMKTEDGLLIAEFEKNAREIVRIRLTQFRGVDLVDVRSFYQNSAGDWKPGKGLALRRELLPHLLKGLRTAEKTAKEQTG